ncbi:hypothetical protein [Pelotomaculum schinkii]|uniref:hypothetical protein n=2 Tax=Pelotomaculum TaxID=191373 RepID=UPI00167D1DB9|nr:hypothetical protein [Pelotomaculum schinkii]
MVRYKGASGLNGIAGKARPIAPPMKLPASVIAGHNPMAIINHIKGTRQLR